MALVESDQHASGSRATWGIGKVWTVNDVLS